MAATVTTAVLLKPASACSGVSTRATMRAMAAPSMVPEGGSSSRESTATVATTTASVNHACQVIRAARSRSAARAAHVALALQVQDHLLGRLVRRQVGGVEHQVGVLRHLVRVGDAGELL